MLYFVWDRKKEREREAKGERDRQIDRNQPRVCCVCVRSKQKKGKDGRHYITWGVRFSFGHGGGVNYASSIDPAEALIYGWSFSQDVRGTSRNHARDPCLVSFISFFFYLTAILSADRAGQFIYSPFWKWTALFFLFFFCFLALSFITRFPVNCWSKIPREMSAVIKWQLSR